MPTAIQWSQAVLRLTPARWTALAEGLPDELLRRSPLPGEWSALECLKHLLDTEQFVFPVRVRCFLEGRDFSAFNPDAAGRKPDRMPAALEMAQTFTALRQESLLLLAGVKEGDLARTARHEELGAVTLGEMLHEWAGHDLMHTVQAERAMMQPFIQGSGPWLPYFSDHVASK